MAIETTTETEMVTEILTVMEMETETKIEMVMETATATSTEMETIIKKCRKRKLKNIIENDQDQRLFEPESKVYIIDDDDADSIGKNIGINARIIKRNSRHWSEYSKHIIKKLSNQINAKELEISKLSGELSKVSGDLLE
ncbi:hypothetical protein RFI_28463, partial [Reticulomyxa filosa]